MRLADVLGLLLLLVAAVSLGLAEVALSRADDLRAFFWLVVGATSLQSSAAVVRPGARA